MWGNRVHSSGKKCALHSTLNALIRSSDVAGSAAGLSAWNELTALTAVVAHKHQSSAVYDWTSQADFYDDVHVSRNSRLLQLKCHKSALVNVSLGVATRLYNTHCKRRIRTRR